MELVEEVTADAASALLDEKMRSLLAIAAMVQAGGRRLTAEAVEQARTHGASDTEIHDTVLIAAAFCMYNRYVDGLATWAPADQDAYLPVATMIVEYGYTGTIAVADSSASAARYR